MEKVSEKYPLQIVFNQCIERETLLIKKCKKYSSEVKDKQVKNYLDEFKRNSEDHIRLLKDTILKLNLKN